MEGNVKREYYLENLNCANCGAKIEREVGQVQGVEKSVLDFVNKRLILELESEEHVDRVFKETWRIVKKFEPDVDVIDKSAKGAGLAGGMEVEQGFWNSNVRRELAELAAGILVLLAAVLLKPEGALGIGLYLLSYLLVGARVLLRAGRNILSGQVFDENFLMAIATVGAFAIGEYPEAASVMIFYQIGELFQDLAVHRSRRSITDLMNIKPEYANLVIGKTVQRVLPEEVMAGDTIIVKPGEKVPLDGVVLQGKSTVDTSALTGESVPRDVVPSEEILSGFINLRGVLKIEVTKEYADSTVSRILELVQNASSRKAKTENFITKFAKVYTPAVVAAAAFLAVVPPLVLSGATLAEWAYRALAFLVVSCPCALVISIPLGFFGGIGGASRQGILIKGSNYLEALNDVTTVVFDKTGTLTEGVFEVVDIVTADPGMDKETLLEYAAYAESHSTHPIASSILKRFGKEIDNTRIQNIEELAGYGIRAEIGHRLIYVGNERLMEQYGFAYGLENETVAGTKVHIAIDDIYGGSIVISDRIRENSAQTIKGLERNRIRKTIMLTGDNRVVADSIGRQLGITEIHSELLPQDKVSRMETLEMERTGKEKLVFVGDGINDAPVLARADIGIAMGGLGSDAAIEAADIVIMNDDPMKVVTAIRIARKTRNIVMQNIIFALGIKAIVLVLVAMGASSMWEAVFADVGVALIAVLNSMRAMKINE